MFGIGQQVVCTASGKWICMNDAKNYKGPSRSEKVTCVGYWVNEQGVLYIRLKEYDYDQPYNSTCFRPLTDLDKQMDRIEQDGRQVDIDIERFDEPGIWN